VIYKNLPPRNEVAGIRLVGMRELLQLRRKLPVTAFHLLALRGTKRMPPLHPHAGMKLQVMAKVVKHLEPLQVRALGCGMPLQAMLRPVMPHQEGKHRVMTKELQVGGTDGMKHPKQRERHLAIAVVGQRLQGQIALVLEI